MSKTWGVLSQSPEPGTRSVRVSKNRRCSWSEFNYLQSASSAIKCLKGATVDGHYFVIVKLPAVKKEYREKAAVRKIYYIVIHFFR